MSGFCASTAVFEYRTIKESSQAQIAGLLWHIAALNLPRHSSECVEGSTVAAGQAQSRWRRKRGSAACSIYYYLQLRTCPQPIGYRKYTVLITSLTAYCARHSLLHLPQQGSCRPGKSRTGASASHSNTEIATHGGESLFTIDGHWVNGLSAFYIEQTTYEIPDRPPPLPLFAVSAPSAL